MSVLEALGDPRTLATCFRFAVDRAAVPFSGRLKLAPFVSAPRARDARDRVARRR